MRHRIRKRFGPGIFSDTIFEIILFGVIWVVYLYYQSKSVFGGDSGDLTTAAYVWGIPHSPGYPLYTLLGALLIRLLPLFTVAWRVALLSSVCGALAVFVAYKILHLLTDSKFSSVLGSLLLAFLYPFWLYSEVPEVFTPTVFLVLLSFYVSMLYRKTGNVKYLYILVMTFGVSIAHHHIFFFVVPSLLVLLWPKRRIIKEIFLSKKMIAMTGLFFAGLSPLLYLPLAALRYPAIDWEHPTTVSGFLALFFRTTYGTFKAGKFVLDSPVERSYSVLSFYKFFIIDFKVIGLLFLAIGMYTAFKKRNYFWPLMIGYLSYTFFLFYSSFPLTNEFGLATYERFIIFVYIFAILFMTLGIQSVADILSAFLSRIMQKKKIATLRIMIVVVFFIYPFSLFMRNYPVIYSLKDNFTAENTAADILASVPKNSLLLLVNDTAIFNTQYVYYTRHLEGNLKLFPIHLYKLFHPYYHSSLRKIYPDVIIPDNAGLTDEDFIFTFLDANAKKFTIMTNFYLSSKKDSLIPHGLLWKYDPTGTKTTLESIKKENGTLWSKYHSIDRTDIVFRNMFLLDNIRLYSYARQNFANYLLEQNDALAAESYLFQAKKLTPDDPDIDFLLGEVFEKNELCVRAEEAYLSYQKANPSNINIYKKLENLSLQCFKDQKKAEKYSRMINDILKKSSVPLKSL